TTFHTHCQDVTLNSTITTAAGTVIECTETFTLLSGTIPFARLFPADVVAGATAAAYAPPDGTPAGSYTIQAVYNGTVNFLGYTNTKHFPIDIPAATETAAPSASATFNTGGQDVTLNATVTSAAGTVN